MKFLKTNFSTAESEDGSGNCFITDRLFFGSVPNFPKAFPFARAIFPFARGTFLFEQLISSFAQTPFPFAQGLFPFAQTSNRFAQTLNPFAQTLNPFAQTLNPFAQTLNPFAQTSNPFAQMAFSISKTLFPKQLWRFLEVFKKIATWDSGDPDMYFDNPNLIWSNPSFLLEPGDPGYQPPTPPPPPTPIKHMKHKPNCPIATITYNGTLIVAAAQKYPKVAARLPANYLTETTTALAKLPADTAVQKDAWGEVGNLTAAQLENFDVLLHWTMQARKTAKLAFFGQTVKLHQEFLVGLKENHGLADVMGRADTILASVQKPENLTALKLKGWTDADTAAFVAARATFPGSTVVQKSGQSEAKKKTIVKTTDASDAYEHVLTVQHAGDLEYPATDPANAPIRAEFRLGIFPPNHYVPSEPTPPIPPATPTQ